MRSTLEVAALLLATGASAAAQQLPFTVPIVDWEPHAFVRHAREHPFEDSSREVMFCVESWKTLPDSAGAGKSVIVRVRRERVGEHNRIRDIGDLCIGAKGEALPIIHTHPDGNCQFSPSDLITVLARRAPFDGIQCGEHHFVWVFAWQVRAIATFVEMSSSKKGG